MKTFVIASLTLVGLTAYALTNIWFYKLGQISINAPRSTTITKKLQESWSKPSSPDVLGESQTLDPAAPPRFSNITKTNLSTKPSITACDPSGKCNSYNDPKAAGCPVTFTDATCNDLCSDPSKRCRDF